MAFTRAFLKAHGVPEDQIDAIMDERTRTLTGYVAEADVQARIDAALADAQANATPPDVKTSPEYIELAEERDMLRALGTSDFSSVKPKFRETVYKMLDHGAEAKPIAEQLTAVQEKYEEYFISEQPAEEPAKPQFGGEVKGAMPSGKEAPSFNDVWKFGKK